MKILYLIPVIFAFLLLTSASKTGIISFSFDIYLAEVSPRDTNQEEVYEDLIESILDQARYLASGRVHGFRFSYFAPSSWELPKADFKMHPQALIVKGSQQLRITNIKKLNPFHYQANVRYILNPEEITRYRKSQEKSITLNTAKGILPYDSKTPFSKEALEDSFYSAIRSYAQERSLSQFEGQFFIKNNQPLLIKSGFTIQYSQIQLIVETPDTFF